MKNTAYPTLDRDPTLVVVDRAGRIVARRVYTDVGVMIAWLRCWYVEIDHDRGALRSSYISRYRVAREFGYDVGPECDGIRFNVFISHCCQSPEAIMVLVRGWGVPPVDDRVQRSGFRDGPVRGTGKRHPYRYFRRKISSYSSMREATCLADETAPVVRASRNAVNLPDPRDDIARCIQRSWKKTRRHQWKDG